MKHDTTLSFYNCEGFMCGICHPYSLYDLNVDHPLSVMERPLLLRDGTVKGYRALTTLKALYSAYALLERFVSVGGDFIIPWYNSAPDRGMEDWDHDFCKIFIKNAYAEIQLLHG